MIFEYSKISYFRLNIILTLVQIRTTMLYLILRPIIRLSLSVFFRNIKVIGTNNLPAQGPAIFVANHPSAVIDPLAVAITLKRRIYFLAGANWFGKGLKRWIFKNQLNMIPVHRPWLSKGEKVANVDMFKDCYKSLEKGNWIILFPEANSITVSKIREIKTGAIRIKSGYEEHVGHKSTVPIIPIGLNYSNPHQFQSKLIVKIGKPIDFIKPDENLDAKAQVRERANQMHEGLKNTVIQIENDDNSPLVKKVSRLFLETLSTDDKISNQENEESFENAQSIAKAINHFEANDVERFQKMNIRIDSYFSKLKKVGVSDTKVSGEDYVKSFLPKVLLLVFGLPFILASIIVYFIPFQLTKILFKKKLRPMIDDVYDTDKLTPAFTGSLIFSLGMVVFMLWTLLFSVSMAIISGHILIGIAVLIIGHPLFNFSLFYSKIALRLNQYLRGEKNRKKNITGFNELVVERAQLILILKEYQNEYDAIKE